MSSGSRRLQHNPLPRLFVPPQNGLPNVLSPLLGDENLSQRLAYNLILGDLSQESCVDCRAGKTCSIHSIGGGLLTAGNIFVAAVRSQSNNGRRLNADMSVSYKERIQALFMDFYSKNPGRTHTHDPQLLDDDTLLGANKQDAARHVNDVVSCGAFSKVLFDALGYKPYDLKYHSSDLATLLFMYNVSVGTGCYDDIPNHDQNASHILLQFDPLIHNTLFSVDHARDVISKLPHSPLHRSVVGTSVNDVSAFVYDYDAAYLNAVGYIAKFVDYVKAQHNDDIDLLIKEVCNLHYSRMEEDRSDLYSLYERVLLMKFRKQLTRTDHIIIGEIPNAQQLIRGHNANDPKLIGFNLNVAA